MHLDVYSSIYRVKRPQNMKIYRDTLVIYVVLSMKTDNKLIESGIFLRIK